MKVILFPSDDGACGLYRMRYPADAVAALGHDVTVWKEKYILEGGLTWYPQAGVPTIAGAAKWPECDVAVFQRPASQQGLPMIRFLKKKGVHVVVEMDDNFHALLPGNIAWWAYRHPDMNTGHLLACIAEADRVVVSTPDLAREYRTDVVVENCVPEWYFDHPGHDLGHIIGWTGTHRVHKGDLRVIGSGLAEALQANPDWAFRVVGESQGVGRELSMEDPPDTGWLPMDEYITGMAALDLGIAPLDFTRFNCGKSWLKGLEYAALGVPFVASAGLPEYERLGAGELVTKPKQWKGALNSLMQSPERRVEQALHNIEIARKWTYEARAELWWEAWTGAT